MKHKHTPGPWVAKGCAVTTSDPFTTFFTKESRCTDGTQRANAHLIAAAPDMLQALGTALETFEWAKREGGDQYRHAVEDLTHVVKQAIAKAKGEPTQ